MLEELAERIEKLDGPELFSWTHLPNWALPTGEHFDGHWVPDCSGKIDYDPVLMRFSCRVYSDGDYCCSLYLGDDTELIETGILSAGSVEAAREAVEKWCRATAQKYNGIIAAALRALAKEE